MGSSTYFQQSINQVNNNSRLNNTLSSSISYSKTFNTVPQVNMSLTATHSQNTQTETINLTLPTKLNDKAYIDDYKSFTLKHKNAIHLIQWIENHHFVGAFRFQ